MRDLPGLGIVAGIFVGIVFGYLLSQTWGDQDPGVVKSYLVYGNCIAAGVLVCSLVDGWLRPASWSRPVRTRQTIVIALAVLVVFGVVPSLAFKVAGENGAKASIWLLFVVIAGWVFFKRWRRSSVANSRDPVRK